MTGVRLNTIAVGVPTQAFDFRYHVSVERSVPVLTEFSARLLRVVGAVTRDELKGYFGLEDREVSELLKILRAENIIVEHDERIALSGYAQGRFDASSDGVPRFTSVVERRTRISFDLLCFEHIPRDTNQTYTGSALELKLPNDTDVSKTIERAERAFFDQFHDIERVVQLDASKRAFGVYKIDETRSRQRMNVPYVVHFDVDISGQVQWKFDDAVALPAKLASKLKPLVADTLHALVPSGRGGIKKFVSQFEDEIAGCFVANDGFDFSGYVNRVHAKGSFTYKDGNTKPLLGALYLRENVDRMRSELQAAITKYREAVHEDSRRPDLLWVAPRSELWGKTRLLGDAVLRLDDALKGSLSRRSKVSLVYCDEKTATKVFKNIGDSEIMNFFLANRRGANPNFEVLLLDGIFGVAVCHVPVGGSNGVTAPVGFATSDPARLSTIKSWVSELMEGAHTRCMRKTAGDFFTQSPAVSSDFGFRLLSETIVSGGSEGEASAANKE